jgi:hypothetical protein
LTNQVPPDQVDNLEVVVGNHTYLTQDPTTGWTYEPSNGRLHLHGPACESYAGSGMLQVYLGCGQGQHP